MNKLKKISALILIISFVSLSFGQQQEYQLSSHILDVSLGIPAADVLIQLEKQQNDGTWQRISENKTDKDGRIKNFLSKDGQNNHGVYKLKYYTAPYFESLEQTSFYPFIEVVFEIKDDAHYHVPITLSAFGYSTYRGS